LGLFLNRRNQKESSKRLIQWIFYTLFFQLKKNEILLNSKQNCSLFFQFVLMKNVQYILTHNFSKIVSQRRSYLSTKHLSSLESQIEKNLLCHSSILPVKVNNEYKSAQLLANYLTTQLAKNRSYRQALKKIFQKAKKFSFLKGIRIACSGRLGGVELAKTEVKKMGQTSLNIFAEKIDYASTKVSTKFGIIGVKIWVCYI
jgi:ribosomal protein S3